MYTHRLWLVGTDIKIPVCSEVYFSRYRAWYCHGNGGEWEAAGGTHGVQEHKSDSNDGGFYYRAICTIGTNTVI